MINVNSSVQIPFMFQLYPLLQSAGWSMHVSGDAGPLLLHPQIISSEKYFNIK